MRTSRVFALLLLGGLGLLTGCTRFQTQWDRTLALGPTPAGLEGAWEGTWQSESTGHHDQLRCLVTKNSEGQYKARFHAKYHTVLTFGYTVPLQVVATNDLFQFSGEANLGWYAGGLYHYDGHVTSTNWNSTYRCKYDHGIFEMSRPR